MENKKQERSVVHLEINGQHYYYGNLKALTNNWTKEQIGISYSMLRNLGINENKPYINDKCIIRKGIIVTTPRSEPKKLK